MKINKIFLYSLLTAGILSACQKTDLYDVNEPEWVQGKIDSIAAAKAKANSGDTVNIDLMATTVGATDNSAGWWTEFSDYFEISSGKKLVLEFTNYSSGASNWNNWNLACANGKRDTDGYGEYFVIRSDNYGWGGSLENGYDAALLSVDYFEEGKAGEWADWLSKMNGASVKMEIDHASAGPTYVTVAQTGTDGIVYTEKFTSEGTKGDPIVVWLVCDGSHFDMKKAYLVPSEITAIEDQQPKSLTVTGAPTTLDIGDEDFWKTAKAVVTFADGTSKEVDTADVTFNFIPDLTTVGEKLVVLSYSKTKQGNFGQAVATSYKMEVTAPITSIEISAAATAYYYAPGTTTPPSKEDIDVASFIKAVVGKTDGSDIEIPSSDYKAEITSMPTTMTDKIVITVTYKEFKATLEVALEQMKSENYSYGNITLGATDNTAGWWAVHAPYVKIEAGSGKIFTFKNYTSKANNWSNFLVVLTNGKVEVSDTYEQTNLDGYKEYGVMRADNFGWGYIDEASVILESNHNWDLFLDNINGATVKVEVINKGATADVKCSWIGVSDNVEYYQNYLNLSIDGDLYFSLTTEAGHLEIE